VLAVWLVWLLRVVVRSDCVRWRVGRVKVGYAPSKALKLSATFEVKYNVLGKRAGQASEPVKTRA
jgi:hypothetical protein